MSTSRRLVSRAVVLGMVALLLTPTTIWADNLDLDGDGLAPVAGSDMAFGSVCLGETVAKAVIFQIHKTGGTHFANGASVAIAPASASAGLSAGGASITLPANWNLLPNGTTRSATTTSTVELTPSTVGPFSGSILYSATAPQAGSGTHSDAAALDVTADVVSCDTTPPSLNLPGDITAEATGPTGAVVTYAASATDANPTNPVVTCSPASGSTFPLGTTAVNCSATDAADNTASGTFSVIVVDTTAPSVGTPSIAAVEATGPAGATVTYTLPAATDIVDGSVAVACSPASGSAFPLGSTAVTCSATDSAGNTGSSAFNIVVEDTTAPTLLVPADITAEATGPGGAAVTYSATALDIVDGAVTPDCSTASGTTFPLGTTNVSCTATDNAGNSTSADFDVTVVDTTPPDISVPPDITVEATGPAGAAVTYTASASDIVDGSLAVDCSPASGSTFALGTTLVTCSASDNAGNIGSNSFDVTVVDTTPPALTLPADQVLEATGPSGAAATFVGSALDIVDGAVPVSCSHASGATFSLGSTIVSCTAVDNAGNLAMGSFTIEVVDTTAPTLLVPADITAEATGPGGAAVTYSATALDIVDGAVTPDCSTASGTTFPLGTTNVSCTATDNAGNSTSADFDVTVVDTTPPDISVPPDITVEATGPAGAAVTYTASASDIVDGSLAVDCSPASGSTFALGTTLVTCSASDNAGNIGSNSFDVTVVDTTPPALTTPSNVVTGPTSVTGAVVAFGAATAVDIVDGSLSATCVPPSGSAFGFGTTTVTCSATDAAGNTGMGSFTVTVNGFTFGGFYQPVDMTMVNTVKGGSTVPVKWELFGASGVEFTSTAAVSAGWPKTQKIDCGSLASLYEDAIETTSSGGTSLRYDATAGQFIYNWQTPKQPNTCWRLDVKFADGTTKSASFKLK